MKLHFDSKQEIQLEAIKAITGIFEGQPLSVGDFAFSDRTYVYLSTIYELNKLYALKKFVIVVPSVVILEGWDNPRFVELYGDLKLCKSL